MLTTTAIEGVVLLQPRRFEDERGFFCETFRASWLPDAPSFVQDNLAYSKHAGVLRGLHFQTGASAQGKLVRAVRGSIFDVAVDIRPGSQTFGQHVSVTLTATSMTQIWVPAGFAHGYVTLEADTEVAYKTTAYYDPKAEGGLAFNDPGLAIDWPVPADALIVADRDRAWPRLAALVRKTS